MSSLVQIILKQPITLLLLPILWLLLLLTRIGDGADRLRERLADSRWAGHELEIPIYLALRAVTWMGNGAAWLGERWGKDIWWQMHKIVESRAS